MNSSSAMPISETPGQLLGVAEQPEHRRPDQRAGDDVAEGRAEPQPAEHSDEHQRRAEHDRAALEDRAGCLAVCGASSPRGVHRREQARGTEAGSRRAAPLRGRAGSSTAIPGQRASSCSSASQRLSSTSASDDLIVGPPDGMPLDQRRRRLAEGTGMDLHRQCSTRRSLSSWTARLIRLPQVGERSSARPSSRSSARGS